MLLQSQHLAGVTQAPFHYKDLCKVWDAEVLSAVPKIGNVSRNPGVSMKSLELSAQAERP